MLNPNNCPQFAQQVRRRMSLFARVVDPCQWSTPLIDQLQVDIPSNAEQLMQMGSLSNLGQMAAGIVHEIRNPLASLKGFLQMLCQEWQGSDCGREYISIMLEEIEDINQIAGQLLHLSRPSEPAMDCCNLGVLTKEIANLLKGQALIHDIEVQYILVPSQFPDTNADSKRLKQAILNLACNAIQAMPQGGTIRIINTYLKAADGFVIEVEDNGSGISQEVLPHIFTPFYSTKGQGGGLGLYLVARIVEEHGGDIKVSSYLGRGTNFKIWLPRQGPSLSANPH